MEPAAVCRRGFLNIRSSEVRAERVAVASYAAFSIRVDGRA